MMCTTREWHLACHSYYSHALGRDHTMLGEHLMAAPLGACTTWMKGDGPGNGRHLGYRKVSLELDISWWRGMAR